MVPGRAQRRSREGSARSSAPGSRLLGALVVLGAILVIHACTDRETVSVVITAVSVTPPNAPVMEGDTVRFRATVTDDRGGSINAPVEWSVVASTVASIDPEGLVTGLSQGETTISAEFRDVFGEATVTVIPAPRIDVDPQTLAFFGGVQGAPIPAREISITNAGGDRLRGLDFEVRYGEDQPADWLDVSIAGQTDPTTLTVTAVPAGLPAGQYSADILITSTTPQVANSPVTVPVTLSLSGFQVVETEGSTVVDEAGSQDSFTVALAKQPSSDVVLIITSGDTGEVTVSPGGLTFTPANWDVPQVVTVTGVDDLIDDGDQVTAVTISVDDASSDTAFHPTPDFEVAVTTLDDGAGFRLAGTEGLSVTEAGSSAVFTVVLNAEPISAVVINVTSLTPTEVVPAAPTVTLGPGNWDQPQPVTLVGVDDDFDDGDQVSTVELQVDPDLSDDDYDSVPPQSVLVTTVDDDTAGVRLIPTPGEGGTTTVEESGTLDTLKIVLDARPRTNVVIDISIDDIGEATVDPTQVTFTTNNWNVEQDLTITGVDDDVDDGDQGSRITAVVVDAISDDTFAGLSASAQVTTLNDDGAGLKLSNHLDLVVGESGTPSDQFEVALLTQPVSPVVVTVTANDPGEVSAVPQTLTFLGTNWAIPQPVFLNGVDDDIVDGTQVTTVTLSVDDSQSDAAYHSVADLNVSVSTLDDDSPAFQISHTGLNTEVTEGGNSDDVSIVLSARPASTVVFDIYITDPTQATVLPAQRTFTTADWDVPQLVTVSAVDDAIDDGDPVTQVVVSVNSASDAPWLALSDQSLDVSVIDNDDSGISVMPTSGLQTTEEGGTAQFMVVLLSEPRGTFRSRSRRATRPRGRWVRRR